MNVSFQITVLALILGCTPASAFPYGSYLKSLSNPQQPQRDPEPTSVDSSSKSPSTWEDYNPNPLTATVGGPVIQNVAEQSILDAQDEFLRKTGQTPTTTNGFGLPPSSTGATNGSNRQLLETVDPYVAAYAAFQKATTDTSAKVATVNFSLSAQQSETTTKQDPYAAMESAVANYASSADAKKRNGIGSSYLDALASSATAAVPDKETGAEKGAASSTSSFVYQGPSIGGQEPYMSLWQAQTKTEPVAAAPKAATDATIPSQETEAMKSMASESQPVSIEVLPVVAVEQIPVIPQVNNPFATGNTFFSAFPDTLENPSTPEAAQTSISDNESPPTITQPKKPFGSGSYLENLASNVVSENVVEPLSHVSDPVVEKNQPTRTAASSQRPLIPIHAIKVAELSPSLQGDTTEEKPFFATFSPKAPVRPRGRPPVPKDLSKSRLERIMSRTADAQAAGAGGASTFAAFQRAEENWSKLKASKPFTYDSSLLHEHSDIGPPPVFVSDDISVGSPQAWKKLRASQGKKLDFDAVVCGGTLGIFFATALALKGNKVCVLEAGELRGREQEWNISMEELQELVRIGVLSEDDVEASVTTEFPGCRAGFKNKEVTSLSGGYKENGVGYECFTPGVLNLGVSPAILLERVKKRFLSLGGQIKEQTPLDGVVVSEKIGSALDLGAKKQPITSRLVIDCMGNASPISKQQRYGKKPDGVCAVVGSCAGGFAPETNTVGDIIYTNSEIKDCGQNGKLQYFWEAFPVGIGRDGKEPGTSDVKTTYMFTYFDADDNRPSLEMLMEDYLDMLPTYQKSIVNAEDDLDFKRVLFAFFPTYQDSPLKPQWSRVLAVGDASGIQSPLSFGGFGSLTRHLDRITTAISEALEDDLLTQDDLAEINAYQPNLSAAWMFQKAMSIRLGQDTDSKFINRLLATNFEVMNEQGPRVIKPFLQDVVRFDGLASSLSGSFVKDPAFMPDIIRHVGIKTLAQWVCHVAMMGVYAFLHAVVTPLLSPFVRLFKNARERFQWRRRMDSWKYGSGSDFTFPNDGKGP